jgi:hypothetical protein
MRTNCLNCPVDELPYSSLFHKARNAVTRRLNKIIIRDTLFKKEWQLVHWKYKIPYWRTTPRSSVKSKIIKMRIKWLKTCDCTHVSTIKKTLSTAPQNFLKMGQLATHQEEFFRRLKHTSRRFETYRLLPQEFLFNNFFSRKSWSLSDNLEKYGRDRQATDDNTTRRMRFACCITKATNRCSEYVVIIAFPQ